jgi:hypothetical protein
MLDSNYVTNLGGVFVTLILKSKEEEALRLL